MKKIVYLLLAITVVSCSNNDEEPSVESCNTSSSEFQTIFGSGGSVTYDFDVHSYNFVLSQNKTVCKIGYQSTSYNVTHPYTIKILQGSTVIYNQTHLFNDNATSYVTPTTAINLTAGVTYTIERIQTDSGGPGAPYYNLQNVGRIKPTTTFPVSSSYMSIVSSKFYFVSSNGSAILNDTAIPFIDIIFK